MRLRWVVVACDDCYVLCAMCMLCWNWRCLNVATCPFLCGCCCVAVVMQALPFGWRFVLVVITIPKQFVHMGMQSHCHHGYYLLCYWSQCFRLGHKEGEKSKEPACEDAFEWNDRWFRNCGFSWSSKTKLFARSLTHAVEPNSWFRRQKRECQDVWGFQKIQ